MTTTDELKLFLAEIDAGLRDLSKRENELRSLRNQVLALMSQIANVSTEEK